MPHEAWDYGPCGADLTKLESGKAYFRTLKQENPGMMIKVGGTLIESRRRASVQYSRQYFRQDPFTFLPDFDRFTDTNLAAWLELELIKYVYYDLKIGVNDNRGQTNSCNKAASVADYNEIKLGGIYVCPALEKYTSQASFFEDHVSYHCQVKASTNDGTYVKGKHMNPELRKPRQGRNKPRQGPRADSFAKDLAVLNALNAPRDATSQFRNLTEDQRAVAVYRHLTGTCKSQNLRRNTNKIMDRLLKWPLLYANHLQ
jgi:hypothetical protein